MDLNQIKQAVKPIGLEIDEIRQAQKQIRASSNQGWKNYLLLL